MKVNIGGRGRIPLVGYIAPLRDYEIDCRLANNLLRYISSYPMYEAETGIMITPSNIRGMFDGNRKVDLAGKNTESQTNNDSVTKPGKEESKEPKVVLDILINYNCEKCGKEFQSCPIENGDPCICPNGCKCCICDSLLEDDGITCTNPECESNKKPEPEEKVDVVIDASNDEEKDNEVTEDTDTKTSDEDKVEDSQSEEPKEKEPKTEVVKPTAPKAPYKKKPTQGKKSASSANSVNNNNQPKNSVTTAHNKSEVNNKEGE